MAMREDRSLLGEVEAAALDRARGGRGLLLTTLRIIEGHARALVWSPGWGAADLVSPPTGFTLAVDGGAPLVASVFHPEKWGYGCSALQLTPEQVQSSRELTEALNMLRARPGVSGPSPEMCARFDAQIGASADVGRLLSAAGRRPFCGVYMSRARGRNRHTYRVWAVAQGGNLDASNALFRHIEDHDVRECSVHERTSWAELAASPECTAAEQAAATTRAELVVATAQAFGIAVGPAAALAAQPLFRDTRTHVLRPHDDGAGARRGAARVAAVQYMSGTTWVHDEAARRGVLLPESPAMGVTLYDVRAATPADAAYLGALPFSTGRALDGGGAAYRSRRDPDFAAAHRRLGLVDAVHSSELLAVASCCGGGGGGEL